MNLRFSEHKKMNQIALWNIILGVVDVPVNIVVASSLASAMAAVVAGSRDLCLHHMAVFIGFTFLKLMFSVFKKTYIALLSNRAEQDYRQSLYQRFMLENSSLHKTEPASYTTVFRRDAQQVFSYYSEILPSFGSSVISLIAYMLYICFALDGLLFAACMMAFGLLSLLQPIILEKFLFKNFIAADQAESTLTQHLVTGQEGFAAMKLFHLHKWFMDQYLSKQKSYRRAGILASASGTFNNTMLDINRFLQTLGLVSILGWSILNGWTNFNAALQIFLLSSNVYPYITKIFHIRQDSAAYHAALQQINKYLQPQKEIRGQVPSSTDFATGLCVSGLCYEVDGNALIEQSAFTLSPGEKCLLRGDNGSGKSTLLALLLGELEPSKGTITLNNEPISFNAACVRSCIAYCPQTAPILHCTPKKLFENALDRQDAISGQLLYEYAEKLGLDKTDMEKPIDRLSGGTQKKVVLSMALAKRSPLLLLDEPEAMLDHKAVESLLAILHGQVRTMLIVTHHHIYEGIADSLLTIENRKILKTLPTANLD